MVQEIAASSAEQNSGANQINNAIQQFNQVIQQNAAGAEEIASTSEQLSAQAESLREAVSFFVIEKNNRKASSPSKTSTGNTGQPKNSNLPKKGASTNGAVIDLDSQDKLDADYQKF